MISPAISDAIDYVSRRARDLVPHPINQEIYGDEPADSKLIESIRKLGVMEAPAILEDGTIISGHRRWRAVMAIDPDTILDCTVLPAFADDLAEQEALVEYNRQREKTFSQRMAEGQVLDRIEYERSKRRQGTRTDIPANLPEGYEPGETREKVAAKVGMKPRTYSKAKKVVEAAEAGDEKAREAVQKIDAGELSVDRAYKEVTGKASVVIQIFPVVSPAATEWHAATHLNGEMPAVGERALAHIRDLQAREVPIDRVLYNHSLVSVEKLETLVTEAGGTVPSVEASEPEPTPGDKPARQYEIKIGYKNPDGGKGGTETFVGEMPEVGERALKSIRDVETLGGCAGKIQFNQQVVPLFELEYLIETACRQEGRLPTPAPEPEPEGAACVAAQAEVPAPVQSNVVIPAEVLDIGPNHQVHIAAWYQHAGMEKPDRHFCFQPISEGVEFVYQYVRHMEAEHPDTAVTKFKVGPYEVSREVFEALRPWGRMRDEKEHTISIYYTTPDGVPLVEFFDGVPSDGGREAIRWLLSPGAFEVASLRRIHFADGAGSDMDITREGLERLAMPAPVAKASGGCCPERRLGKDGQCTGCGTTLLPEVLARYLHLLRDEFEATMQFSRYPYESVMIVDMGGRYAVVVVPPTGDLPEALVEHLMGEAAE